MVSSGVITPKQMKSAMIITTILTLLVALLLIYVSFGKENFGYSVLFFWIRNSFHCSSNKIHSW